MKSKNIKKLGRLGFDGRQFLSKEEWMTFCRNLPVRYVLKRKSSTCFNCGLLETQNNKFENSHIIGFRLGIIELGLTPDFVNSWDNIVTAHKIKCNKKSELTIESTMVLLIQKGIRSLPHYLPEQTLKLWQSQLKWFTINTITQL